MPRVEMIGGQFDGLVLFPDLTHDYLIFTIANPAPVSLKANVPLPTQVSYHEVLYFQSHSGRFIHEPLFRRGFR